MINNKYKRQLKYNTQISNLEKFQIGGTLKEKILSLKDKWLGEVNAPGSFKSQLLTAKNQWLGEVKHDRGYGGGATSGAGAESSFGYPTRQYTVAKKDTLLIPLTENFEDAFKRAKNSGLNKFLFNNKLYTTDVDSSGNYNNINRIARSRVELKGIVPLVIDRGKATHTVTDGNLKIPAKKFGGNLLK